MLWKQPLPRWLDKRMAAAVMRTVVIVGLAIVCQQHVAAQSEPLIIPDKVEKTEKTEKAHGVDKTDGANASSVLPNAVVDSASMIEQPLTPVATELIKGMALALIPETISDDDDWGRKKKIQSGLNVKMEGLELKTSRRWKDVNHGLWRRVDAKLVDPEKLFQLKVWILPVEADGYPRYRISTSLRASITVRQQQWNRGLKVYSVSCDILSDVTLDAVIDFRSKMVKVDEKQKLQILPHMESANIRVDRFSIRRISHAKGGAVREFGKMFEGLVRKVAKRKGQKLPSKVNSKIEKKADRFQISGTMLGIFGMSASDSDSSR